MIASTWKKCGHERTPANTCNVSVRQPGGQCRTCHRKVHRRHLKTAKGRASQQCYDRSARGHLKRRAREARYAKTNKGCATRTRYWHSEKGRAVRRRYDVSKRGRERARRYNRSEKGREKSRIRARRYRAVRRAR